MLEEHRFKLSSSGSFWVAFSIQSIPTRSFVQRSILQTPRRFHLEENFRPSRAFVHPIEYLPYLESSLFITERTLNLDDLMRRFFELTAFKVISLPKT